MASVAVPVFSRELIGADVYHDVLVAMRDGVRLATDRPATQILFHDSTRPSRLILPVTG
jgi:hypothetical protein